jgi:hypothetical protein
MTPFEFGCYFGQYEKQALHPVLTGMLQGGKKIVKGLGGIDNAAGGLLRSVGSLSGGVGKLFGSAGQLAKPVGEGIVRGGEALATNNIKNETLRDLVRMVGYATKTTGKGVTSSGGGANIIGGGFNLLGKGLKGVGNVGYGVPTAATLGLGGAGFQAGVLQNPVRVAPSGDHIDVRSPVTLPPSVRNMIGEPPPRRPRPRYTASGKRIR